MRAGPRQGELFLATGTLLPNRAEAAPWGAAMPQAQNGINLIEAVALCFYPNGWAGPGYYQCGYRLRYGEGFYERREHEEREEHRERRDSMRIGGNAETATRIVANAGTATSLGHRDQDAKKAPAGMPGLS